MQGDFWKRGVSRDHVLVFLERDSSDDEHEHVVTSTNGEGATRYHNLKQSLEGGDDV